MMIHADTPVKKVTMNLPAELLRVAMQETGSSQTETVTAGLEHLAKKRHYRKLKSLRGSGGVEIDIAASREDRTPS